MTVVAGGAAPAGLEFARTGAGATATAVAVPPSAPAPASAPASAPVAPDRAKAGRALTWSLVVCTYRREKILPRCVRCALASTRRPVQVVIVDASPYWDVTRAAVLGEFEAANPDVAFHFVKANRASLTAQRNQGLALSTGDVSFCLDDDSLLLPDAAEKIMAIYEADIRNEVVALTPVFVHTPPDAGQNVVTPGHPATGHVAHDESKAPFLRRLLRRLLWSDVQLLPYDGDDEDPARALPRHLRRFDLVPTRFSSGSATFRTEVVRQVRFEECLERYAAAEDWDISYRLRGRGVIAFVPGAGQCHLEAPGGRLSRRTVTTLRYLNFMALHVLHSTDVARSRRLHRGLLWRRVLSDTLADLAKGRFKLQRGRGAWRALRLLPEIFSRTPEQIRAWYPQFQRDLIARDTGEERPR